MRIKSFLGVLTLALTASVAAGCSQGKYSSYPAEKIKESLLEICRKEYGIQQLDVKIKGRTIGVYLPLKKLFAADFKEAAVTGKVRNLEALFEPSPEALEKVEDVLFTISRVLLSTDKDFDFYVLQATDVEKTGMQLVLSGYVNDIKRVRIWDIPRSEYRKRVIHELRLNRAVIWHRPVRRFFEDLENLSLKELEVKYFLGVLPPEAIQQLFFEHLSVEESGPKTKWEVLEMRSAPVQKNEVLVYARVKPQSPEGETKELRYLFMLSVNGDEDIRIARIIPFQYRDDEGDAQSISFLKELQFEQNLEKWEEEFPLENYELGPFLAEQLNRRMQGIAILDERIHNTFYDVKLSFDYVQSPEPAHFSLDIEASLKDLNNYQRNSMIFHEDMMYLVALASREFVNVLRSYQFGDYDYLSLQVAQEPTPWLVGREDLELFRRKKVDFQGLLASLPQL